jgi:hypothetical protein
MTVNAETIPYPLPRPIVPHVPEPRDASAAFWAAKKAENIARVLERGRRLFEPLVDDPVLSTTGYIATCERDDMGEFTGRVKVGKPAKKDSDYTAAYNGPYWVDIVSNRCECPFFQSDGFCKHQIGLLLWLGEVPYTISAKHGIVQWQRTTLAQNCAELPVGVTGTE